MDDEIHKELEQQPSDDYVSRQEVIRIAEQGQVQGFEWQISKLVALPPVTPTQSWIPISERLPRQEVEVLTFNEHGFIEIQSLEDGYWENQHGDCTDLDDNNVISWQPLPKPYEEKRGNMEILNAVKKSFLSDKNSLWFLFGVWIGFVIIAILKLLLLI